MNEWDNIDKPISGEEAVQEALLEKAVAEEEERQRRLAAEEARRLAEENRRLEEEWKARQLAFQEEQKRQFLFLQCAEQSFRLGLHALKRIHNQNSFVQRPEGPLNFR